MTFIGMRFDTIAGARAHYNAYALGLGFSIKSNTSKRAPRIRVLEKQQFVCNKHRAPKTEKEIQKEKVNAVVDKVSHVQLDSDDDASGDPGASKKPTANNLKKKRKRESIRQTGCPAKMVVKLINNKWVVTYFIAEHNHDMIDKPSLSKYLRSHRGIPRMKENF